MASRSNEGIGKEPLDELVAGRDPADASKRRASRLSAGTALSREGSAACYASGALLAAFAVLALPLQVQAQPAVTLVSNTGQTGISTFSSIQSQPFTGGHSGGYALTSVEVGIGTLADEGTIVRVVPNASSGQPDLSGETTFIALTAPASLAENAINTFIAPASTTPAANTTYHVYASAMNDGTRDNIQRTSSNAEDIGGAANNPPTGANAIPDQSATDRHGAQPCVPGEHVHRPGHQRRADLRGDDSRRHGAAHLRSSIRRSPTRCVPGSRGRSRPGI